MSYFSRIKKPQTEIEIGDYYPGHIDPTTGKNIIYIAYQTPKFIVSIDADINLTWYTIPELKFAEDFGQIASQVALTEALVDRIFVGKTNKIAYKKILADVLARVLDDENSKTAFLILEEAKKRVLGHGAERVRMAYIAIAVWSVAFTGILVVLAVLFRDDLHSLIAQPDIFKIMVCTLLGGVGAFITTFARFQNYQGNIFAGLPIHRLDGFLRVFYGLIAGLIISLAIKGKVLAGFANEQQPWILYFFAMIAGASEILIPNLIKQAEKQANLAPTDPPQPPPTTPPPPQQQDPLVSTPATASTASPFIETPLNEKKILEAKIDNSTATNNDTVAKDDSTEMSDDLNSSTNENEGEEDPIDKEPRGNLGGE